MRFACYRLPLNVCLVLIVGITATPAVTIAQSPRDNFRQLDDVWPTPNEIRRPSGAPGDAYWQQKADYDIQVRIDEKSQQLTGSETITYHNNSPDELDSLWLQLDQNRYASDSADWLTAPAPEMSKLSYIELQSILYRENFDGGHRILAVRDAAGKPLQHTIIRTMMRIRLPKMLKTGETFSFQIDWNFPIVDGKATRVRGGYEYFKKDANYIYTIAQWYPRLCAYTDYHGWQNRQTLDAEFALEFGDFRVRITVPEDHVVASTGELANASEVLTEQQQQRLTQAATSSKPVLIVTEEEAAKNETTKSTVTRTWEFTAGNVRDFAFASSRKFLWDAQGIELNGRKIMAMSFWPKEGQPLWQQYSTAAVIHAVRTYSKFTFDYPYPVIISVNGAVRGMEYPMITFQDPRPEDDGTYTEQTKHALISVVIHEVGHNWFPMVVNSDERQWRWMDEGMNSFLQLLAEQEWEDFYPSRILRPDRRQKFYDYLKTSNKRPIMSAADDLIDGGHTAYSKPTLALMILRETIIGREQFDYAFKRYANRWKFKRPTPFDFFRTMEESSGYDLDWFWRAWFYSTDHVDISIDNVRQFKLNSMKPEDAQATKRTQKSNQKDPVIIQRNKDLPKRVNQSGELKDFYSSFDELTILPDDREAYKKLIDGLEPFEKTLHDTKGNFYVIDFANIGGVVMPLLLEIKHTDGSVLELRIPAEVWRRGDQHVSKLIHTTKQIASITLDPLDETADLARDNNVFPRQPKLETFELQKEDRIKNPMQQLNKGNQ